MEFHDSQIWIRIGVCFGAINWLEDYSVLEKWGNGLKIHKTAIAVIKIERVLSTSLGQLGIDWQE